MNEKIPDINKVEEIVDSILKIECLGEMSRCVDDEGNVERYIQIVGDFYDKDELIDRLSSFYTIKEHLEALQFLSDELKKAERFQDNEKIEDIRKRFDLE